MNDQNLTKLLPGQIINPKGRGKGTPNRGTVIRKWLKAKSTEKNPISKETEHLTQQDWIVIAMIGQARKGNVRAAEFLFDAKYGALLRAVDPNKIPEDTANRPEDFAPFSIVDPVDNEVIEIEIGAAS